MAKILSMEFMASSVFSVRSKEFPFQFHACQGQNMIKRNEMQLICSVCKWTKLMHMTEFGGT